ncbi:ribonucleoside-triphosphate reductase, adenosylcobalamin-dependent [Hassallia byssoidea VB512170]|uniref:Ribonucleoside-triphosphate reductase, adenosylcobalamin-dependent n=1 Tax=Hassallia byssoidea VB512170 TaxID=1304833 RepID=A0A846HCQ2_9CYAN|nr:ribonucleoside-triphosphate reductase, adenosylcobalamin-dependent [Hassalia byssoidea]NEU74708.1 ribonucleoside-triphosphate reductase, adenosylcobalamin-dependent [Hassalia byssoidea VB512170]
MVRELELKRLMAKFPETAPAANPVFFRTYSRALKVGQRETWEQVCDRTLRGLTNVGKLRPEDAAILQQMQQNLKALPSGRWLWVGGTDWISKPKNFSGGYNCTSTNLEDWNAFGLMMDLAMMGCGTGTVIEAKYISKIPPIRNRLNVSVQGEIGSIPVEQRREFTETKITGNSVTIHVGDSRQGWVESYQTLLKLSSDERFSGEVEVIVDISDVRKAGETLKGFGGVANPVKLPGLYERCASILNKAVGRQLNSVECCLLIDQAAVTIVAGNIRRCLPEDALVHTNKGLVPIRNIQVGDLVQTPLGFRRVVDKFDQGFQDVYEIETNATYPRATLNHKQAVLFDAKGGIAWKSVANLVEGDRLLHNTQVLPGTVTHLPPDFTKVRPAQSQNAKSFKVPELTSEVAWLIGFTHGDGYVALGRNKHEKPYGRVEWAMNSLDTEVTAKIQVKIDAALALFGLFASHGIIKGENTAKSICSSIRLAEYFHRYIKQPNVSLEVPSFILQGSIDIRAAYLAGLMDSDGGINNRPPQVTTVYRSFARHVGAVLSSLGIAGRISITRPQQQEWKLKYNLTIPALKGRYNALIAPHSVKGELLGRLKMYGFTVGSAIMREAYAYSQMREMGFEGSRLVDANYERYIAESEQLLDIPVTVKGLGSYDYVQTYDIEVEEAHCFYCDGYLTHNSAGMRQFDSSDRLAATAKDNLWQQDDNGNWRIDPERDALRMANHTRVFHRKPTLEECIDAVRKQYYSGEGAIQWAGEALARANCDLLSTQALKTDFLQAYEQGTAKQWLQKHYPQLDASELEHRLARYGLNPCGEIIGANFHCVSGNTLLITREGMHNIKDVVGCEIEIWNGKKWSLVTPFKTGSNQKLYRVRFGDGSYLDATEYHRFFVKDRLGKVYKEVQTKDLMDTSRYSIHTEPFTINYEDGLNVDSGYAYTLGVAVGDGTTDRKNNAKVRLYENKAALSVVGNKSPQRTYDYLPTFTDVTDLGFSGEFLKSLKTNSQSLNVIASWKRQAILHFIAGLADTDGSNTSSNGIRIYISDYERAYRIQLLLTKCGIRSSLNLCAHKGSITNLGVRSRDLYYLQITDCQQIPCQRLDVSKGTNAKCKGKWQVVKNVEELPGLHDTYCFNEPEYHKGVFGNTLTGNCNLSEVHLNQIDPTNYKEQEEAFTAGALSVAALLHHKFLEPRYQYSRELDPIVGVSFTGLFDFFVNAFGADWLRWWAEGRPENAQGLAFKQQEEKYLTSWKDIVHRVVWDYCDRHNFKRPNRCTTVQPSGTKSLLTGASPGWHPPKAQRFLRRITFGKNDPVALACIDYGYNVIPSQSDKDEKGNLLNDPFDPRCSEWLVEIPVAVPWADIPGVDEIDISQFSAIAQMDFYMQVQKFYVTHNTSATIELRENEVEALSHLIWQAIQNDEGYISAALLARFDDHQTFPRLPFEPITKQHYEQLLKEVEMRRQTDDFHAVLSRYDSGELMEAGPAGCDSDKCMMPEQSPM